MTEEETAEAVAKLDTLGCGPGRDYDKEEIHMTADNLLAESAPKAVREAYARAYDRIRWWYA